MANTVLGKVSLTPKGEYNPQSSYTPLDLVRYAGQGYIALRNVQGVVPVDGEDYMLLVERGEEGASIQGITRTAGNGAPGTTDTYTITLTDGNTETFSVYNGADGNGSGDMTKLVYDPQGKNTDVFEYVDEKYSELFTSVSNGKATVASAITDMGVDTADDATFAAMAENIRLIDSSGSFPYGGPWIKATFENDEIVGCGPVHYANGLWVAGQDVSSGGAGGLCYSEDGKHWYRSNTTTGYFSDIEFGGGLWVAGSSTNGIYYSEDGKNWTQSNVTVGDSKAFVYAEGVWNAVGSPDGIPDILYSLDGKSWNRCVASGNSEVGVILGRIYASGSLRIATSASSMLYSNDGISWAFGSAMLGSLCDDGSLWVGTSYTNAGLLYSNNGIDWTQSNITEGEYSYVYFSNGLWFALSNESTRPAVYSSDGKNWIESNLIAMAAGEKAVRAFNGVWLAATRDWTTYELSLYYSTDCKTWKVIKDAVESPLRPYYGNGLWVCTAGYNGVYYSEAIGMGVQLPVLSNPAEESDVFSGKEYIDQSGNKKTGTYSPAQQLVTEYFTTATVSSGGTDSMGNPYIIFTLPSTSQSIKNLRNVSFFGIGATTSMRVQFAGGFAPHGFDQNLTSDSVTYVLADIVLAAAPDMGTGPITISDKTVSFSVLATADHTIVSLDFIQAWITYEPV